MLFLILKKRPIVYNMRAEIRVLKSNPYNDLSWTRNIHGKFMKNWMISLIIWITHYLNHFLGLNNDSKPWPLSKASTELSFHNAKHAQLNSCNFYTTSTFVKFSFVQGKLLFLYLFTTNYIMVFKPFEPIKISKKFLHQVWCKRSGH